MKNKGVNIRLLISWNIILTILIASLGISFFIQKKLNKIRYEICNKRHTLTENPHFETITVNRVVIKKK